MFKKKKNYKWIIGFVVGIVVSITTVYAVTYVGSGSDLTYDNSSSGLESTNVQDALDELYKYKDCPRGYKCYSVPKVGDYISMTPTKTSYTVTTSQTGADTAQTINPQELNLWRVIRVNDDASVDAVSHYTSSIGITLSGSTGYLFYVDTLNTIAQQYENSTYTQGSRSVGYNGQTKRIVLTPAIKAYLGTSSSPWCSTCEHPENLGGGDDLYSTDISLIRDAYGSDICSGTPSISWTIYFIASRGYSTSTDSWSFSIKLVRPQFECLVDSRTISGTSDSSVSAAVRPIVTFKPGLKYSGSGTEDDPYKLST